MNKKLREKPEAMLGLVFSQEKGFQDHESKEVFYKYEYDPDVFFDYDKNAIKEAGYEQVDGAYPYGWEIFEKKDGEFKYVLSPGDHHTLHDLYPYGICFVFLKSRADMMEFFIRIAPTVAAEALFNLMEGSWGSDHAPDGFSFSAAIGQHVRKLR